MIRVFEVEILCALRHFAHGTVGSLYFVGCVMKKWQKDVEAFMSMISDDKKAIYGQIIDVLLMYEYRPIKNRCKGFVMSFKKMSHRRVIATVGVRQNSTEPFFGLRFSACTKYSDKFSDVVRDRLLSNNSRLAKCSSCGYCTGSMFVYSYTFSDGETKSACGAFILEIPNITVDDIVEIERLVKEQHEYFEKYADWNWTK